MISHSAIDPYLGYLFQGYYALLVLFDSEEEEASITLEIEDDIALHEEITTLIQVKHRQKIKKELTIKSIEFWKTIRIWIKIIKEENFFTLATCDSIKDDNILIELTKKERDIEKLKKELVLEAKKVLEKRKAAKVKGEKLPYENRYQGCKEFLKLKEKDIFLKKIYILDRNITIDNISEAIEERLSKTVTKINRGKIAKEIEKWWSVRVVKALKEKKEISKQELTFQVEDFIRRISENKFIVSLDARNKIPSEELEKNKREGSIMLEQINLIDKKSFRKKKALNEFWSARIQRNSWIEEDLSVINELEDYDFKLVEEWEYKFETKVDVENLLEKEKMEIGKDIYDYSVREGYLKIQPKIEEWKNKSFVAGSYQILSNDLKVGWHPDYKKILNMKGEKNE